MTFPRSRASEVPESRFVTVPFHFGEEQRAAQEDLKKALLASPALRPLDYTSDSPVILAVDTSPLTVGFYLCQADKDNPRKQLDLVAAHSSARSPSVCTCCLLPGRNITSPVNYAH